MFDCPQCIKSFLTYQEMKRHIEEHAFHTNPEPYVKSECIVCSKVYGNSQDLNKHLKAMHNLSQY